MGNKNELLQKIDEKYSKFSKGQKKLADFIIAVTGDGIRSELRTLLESV